MAKLQLEHTFDSARNRHYLNGMLSVFHCHHYATLFTQLAIDAEELANGVVVLKKSSEQVFFSVLDSYVKKHSISTPDERLDIARQLYTSLGMGRFDIIQSGESEGEIIMHNSHLDQGWLKKWGQSPKPVNHIGCGFLAASWAVAYKKPIFSYAVVETQSIVCGAKDSIFKVSL